MMSATCGAARRPASLLDSAVLEGTTMAQLAGLLQNEVRRAIVDRTGLTGTFDLELEFAPQGQRPLACARSGAAAV